MQTAGLRYAARFSAFWLCLLFAASILISWIRRKHRRRQRQAQQEFVQLPASGGTAAKEIAMQTELQEAPQAGSQAPAYVSACITAVERNIESMSNHDSSDGQWLVVAERPPADCKLRISPENIQVQASLDTADQAPEGFSLLRYSSEGVTGAIPLFLELSEWPSWFPFCNEATLLAQWGKGELDVLRGTSRARRAALWHLVFRIGPVLGADSVVMVAECPDGLAETGRLRHYMWSPKLAGPDQSGQCLGAMVPPQRRALLNIRVPIAWSRTVFQPFAPDRGVVEHCNKLVNLAPPIEWAASLFWRTIATRAVGFLSRRLGHQVGLESADRREYYRQLDEDMQALFAKRALRQR